MSQKKLEELVKKKRSENVPMDPPRVHTKFQVSSTSIISKIRVGGGGGGGGHVKSRG